ncbi:MAG: ABC transporter ATP-binding protein [Leptolyngbyaceae cyanobacterium SL_5_9]|nr:ABC transporter ATP-binding protein [Leptolyngbyaceae cyanobacterium SM1_4_3]NJN57728.1 ABC transporter ATP-binding protein [Leptolyngbyaceae cyanobacterium SL_5_9]
MSDEVMIRVDRVSKKYCRDLKRSLRYGLYDLADELLLKRKTEVKLRHHEFWALRNLSFELNQGESLGVIGVNGSGKTTLLKMLQGLIKPSRGSITVRGHVGALISLGAGFQPILSGRENIYINASILGISKQTVDRKLSDIIDFADIGDFIDAPVRSYSSGMKMRLGFSVATNLVEPDVLLIDEVLAAGDMAFKYKCMQRMKEIMDSGTTVVFVSHSIRQVEQLCQRTLLLNKGTVEDLGPTQRVCQKYYELVNQKTLTKEITDSSKKPFKGLEGQHANPNIFEIAKIELLNTLREPQEQFYVFETVVIRLHFVAHQLIRKLIAGFQITTVDGVCISAFSSESQDIHPDYLGSGYVDCVIPKPPMREGAYLIGCAIWDSGGGKLFTSTRLAELSVIPDQTSRQEAGSGTGLVYIPVSWHFSPIQNPW